LCACFRYSTERIYMKFGVHTKSWPNLILSSKGLVHYMKLNNDNNNCLTRWPATCLVKDEVFNLKIVDVIMRCVVKAISQLRRRWEMIMKKLLNDD
jgi:hypothetical protein